jgi:hypothetical protein
MKKNDLIEMLSKIDGNPEIKIWNGYVEDFMDLDPTPVPVRLVKMTEDYLLEMVRLEQCMDAGADRATFKLSDAEIADTKRCYKQYHEWELNQFVTDKDIKSKNYKARNVIMLNPKARGKKTFDRIGTLEY